MKDALDRDADLARNASEAVAAKKIGLQQKANELMLEEKKLEGIREKMKAEALTQLQVSAGYLFCCIFWDLWITA